MFRVFLQVLAAVTIIGLGATGAQAQSCADESTLKSSPETKPTEITFRNGSGESRRVYWIDPDGRRKFYAAVAPGNAYSQSTFVSHSWVVTDEAESCLFVITASSAPISVEIGGSQAGAPKPPMPGGQQPVAAASPIEALKLDGYYRLTPRSDDEKALNNQSSGKLEVEKVKPEWSSGQWEFEEVDGTPYALIKNRWKDTFLQADGNEMRAASAKDGDEKAHWALEAVAGKPYVRIKSRTNGRYLVVNDDAAELAAADDSDADSHWQLMAVGAKETAATEDDGCSGGTWKGGKCRCPEGTVFDAGRCEEGDHGGVNCAASGKFYDGSACVKKCPPGTYGEDGYCEEGKEEGKAAKKKTPLEYARENCKETGGYWTGKTCKASKTSKPQKCKQGFAWSEDAGKCQWDGGPAAAKPQQQPSTSQQIENVIQGIQNLKHKCGKTQFWSKQEKACIEDD